MSDERETQLGQLPASYTFDKLTISDTLRQLVLDKNFDGVKRLLFASELLVMALNEIACEQGSGFFMHLRGNRAWYVAAPEHLRPASRSVASVHPEYPIVVYMRYAWSPQAVEKFKSENHRIRFLISNGLINAPTDGTPMYSLQVFQPNILLYDPPTPSLLIIPTKNEVYLLRSSVALEIAGCHKDRQMVHDCQPIATLNFVASNNPHDPRIKRLQHFACQSTLTLYERIRYQCRDDYIQPRLTGERLHQILPRPTSPERGIPLGAGADMVGKKVVSRTWRSRGQPRRPKQAADTIVTGDSDADE